MSVKRVKAAEGVVLAALVGSDSSAAGIAAALESACLLQSPELAAEVQQWRAALGEEMGRRRRAEEEIDRLRAERNSTNEALDDAVRELSVLRARVAELEAAAVCPSVARIGGSKCVLPVRHRGDHQDETKRHYWSDDYAVPQQRQVEDPHDGPLHHDYAVGRDLPAIPHQQDRRAL